jgi:predicted RNA methylase
MTKKKKELDSNNPSPFEYSQFPNPLVVLDEINLLPDNVRDIVAGLFYIGAKTAQEISKELSLELFDVEAILENLCQSGWLIKQKILGEEKYIINILSKNSERFPDGPVIPLIYQYNLLSDINRSKPFAESIRKTVKHGDVVTDLGAGVGFLSFVAAEKAKIVQAVEIDSKVRSKGEFLLKLNNIKNVKYFQYDARKIEFNERADVVICEMLDTALVSELQIEVMNNALDNVLKPNGKMIPSYVESTVQLANSKKLFEGYTFPLIHYESYGSPRCNYLSEEKIYSKISFDVKNDLNIDTEITVRANKTGIVNAIIIRTYVKVPKIQNKIPASSWLNPPVVIPLAEDIPVTKDTPIDVLIEYTMGLGWHQSHIDAFPKKGL